ncbi:hypothetical protein BUALT_Bualt03G0156500 [Buddleja alternifolia]|uniref:3-beta hydroxysteroid dehydrogenase/isomerase domain-containing protein n=1 Tax=Buddleja alternifolia TaxID=168488 RepID=A0AAV6Y4X9_9LAMI|nr:hypothetical protein BUALT_Bualt03G0156500 [Buddleja alternifolia]
MESTTMHPQLKQTRPSLFSELKVPTADDYRSSAAASSLQAARDLRFEAFQRGCIENQIREHAREVRSSLPCGDSDASILFCEYTLIQLQVEVVEPAIRGTLNVLKACSEAQVKRVVLVSSVAMIAMKPGPRTKLWTGRVGQTRNIARRIM